MRGSSDTIAAIATAPGPGAIGIIRVSGPETRRLAVAVLGGVPAPRTASCRRFMGSGHLLDEGIALFFPGPHSFTGEDVLELQGHGGPVVLDQVLRQLFALGARQARPGEFSERAFLNGKLDLAQAEAIADLIESRSEAAARGALRSLQGAFSQEVDRITEGLAALRVQLEAAIDFPDEGVDTAPGPAVDQALDALVDALAGLEQRAARGRVLNDGLTVVLLGLPNTGKSSLLNALAGDEAAIVSNLPGTTRDLLRVHLTIAGLPVEVIDTAGLHEGADEVEREGMRRARLAAERADVVLVLVDDRDPRAPPLSTTAPILRVHNKIDLTGRAPGVIRPGTVALSAITGHGLDALRRALQETSGVGPVADGTFSARRRHLEALARTRALVEHGRAAYRAHGAAELLAEDLRQAQQVTGEITGRFTTEDLLGRIFSSFCIGK